MNCLAGKSHFPAPTGHHHERSINGFSVFSTFFDTVATGWVHNIFGDFLLQRQSPLKITKLCDDRINAAMKNLSTLCVGGKGQLMLAGGKGGRGLEPKSRQIKKVGLLR